MAGRGRAQLACVGLPLAVVERRRSEGDHRAVGALGGGLSAVGLAHVNSTARILEGTAGRLRPCGQLPALTPRPTVHGLRRGAIVPAIRAVGVSGAKTHYLFLYCTAERNCAL